MTQPGSIRLNIVNYTENKPKKTYPNLQGKKRFNQAIATIIDQAKVKVTELPAKSAQSPKKLHISKGGKSLNIDIAAPKAVMGRKSNFS